MLNVLTQNSYGLGRRLILLAALLVVLAAGTLVPASDRTLPLAGLALAALIALVGTTQDRTEARRLQTPALNQQPAFCDDLFAQEGNWVTMHHADSFTQRYLHADGNTLCETLLETHGDADQALAPLRGPWTWWGRSHAREYSELPGNTTDQIPVPWYWCHVRMRLLPPPAPSPVPLTASPPSTQLSTPAPAGSASATSSKPDFPKPKPPLFNSRQPPPDSPRRERPCRCPVHLIQA